MEILYTVDERPDTGLYNAKMGMWLFLASEIMLFGALFSSYILLRVGAVEWPRGATELNVPLGTVNTLILIFSSVCVIQSWAALKLKDFGKYKLFMGMTVLFAIIFMLVKAFEYSTKFQHHHFPSTNMFFATYFTLTGLHGLHVIGGILVMFYLWGPGSKMWLTQPERFTNRVEVAGLYWHFVDLVWIFLFPTLYLL